MSSPRARATSSARSSRRRTRSARACTPRAAVWTSLSRTAACRPTASCRRSTRSWPILPVSSRNTTTSRSARCTVLRSPRARRSPCLPTFCARAPCSRESTACACTPTCARRRTRKTSCSHARASARSSTWSASAGRAATSGSPTASTSTTRSCACWQRHTPAWRTARSRT